MLRISSTLAKRGLAGLVKRQLRPTMARGIAMVCSAERSVGRKVLSQAVVVSSRAMSSYPEHLVVPMPALSPTMETGSIVGWNIKEGQRFEAGDAICEVETDKATVAYEATDAGYLAKILINSGEVKVGQPIMVTVEEEGDIAAFANFSAGAAPAAAPAAAAPAAPAATSAPAPAATQPAASSAVSAAPTTGRVVASPYARKLASENGISINAVGGGSGPNGRIIAEDVTNALSRGVTAAAAPVAAPTAAAAAAPAPAPAPKAAASVGSDFVPSPIALALGNLFAVSKKTVPHYHLSVELNMAKAQQLCDLVNAKKSTTVPVTPQNVVFKAAALAMRKVPVANATFMDSFVRCYDKVDINVFMGSGDSISAPLLRDAATLGVTDIAAKTSALSGVSEEGVSTGTFSIHDLGAYGVKSAAAIVLPPQSTALALGSLRDAVIPRANPADGEPVWEVAPMMTATLACDHRVVDGAVGAEWLAVFKEYVEDPTSMIL